MVIVFAKIEKAGINRPLFEHLLLINDRYDQMFLHPLRYIEMLCVK